MTAATLNSVSLGNLSNISYTKELNILPISYPGLDEDATEAFDLGGAVTTVTLNGTITGTTLTNVRTSVNNLLAIADGDQASSVTFYSDQTGSLYTKIVSMDFVWNLPGIGACDYTIKLLRGT